MRPVDHILEICCDGGNTFDFLTIREILNHKANINLSTSEGQDILNLMTKRWHLLMGKKLVLQTHQQP